MQDCLQNAVFSAHTGIRSLFQFEVTAFNLRSSSLHLSSKLACSLIWYLQDHDGSFFTRPCGQSGINRHMCRETYIVSYIGTHR